jgi:patatin-related protein
MASETTGTAPQPIPPASRALADDAVKELRLAVVCYGGVSLAIYMHGITKELQKLVETSRLFEHDPSHNPYGEGSVQHAYFQALRRMRERDSLTTRVVVDVISGTSAGGINGIILAKALAGNLSQEPLRDLWLDSGDIKKLMRPHAVPGLWLKSAAWAASAPMKRLFGKSAKPPLDGDLMFQLVLQALTGMEKTRPAPGSREPETLMPDGHALELFVTTTDFTGVVRSLPAYSPKLVSDLSHRHVLEFKSLPHDRFGGEYNPELAFAARATSCFPGAFPPIDVGDIERIVPNWTGGQRFVDEFFGSYVAAGAEMQGRYFVDGGVLDNFPFDHAVEAIVRKAADVQVDRRLVYIEPDPKEPVARLSGRPPGFLDTVLGAVSTIPATQPIAGAFDEMRDFNERVDRVNAVIQVAYGAVDALVPPMAGPGIDVEAFRRANTEINEHVAGAGPAYLGYLRLKLESVIDALGSVAAGVCGFRPDSDAGAFVRIVVRGWAIDRGILTDDPQLSDEQVAFLKTFDLGYAERRLRFVIKRLNRMFHGVERRTAPPYRADLNSAKQDLYDLVRDIREAQEAITQGTAPSGPAGNALQATRRAFPPARVADAVRAARVDADVAMTSFLNDAKGDLDLATEAIGDYLKESLPDPPGQGFDTLAQATEGWSDDARRDLMVAFAGFPYWDGLTYPIRTFSRLGELDRVEIVRVSPKEPSQLSPPTGRLKLMGVPRHHFGAFFSREARENDYLWGRLDGAEQLIRLLLGEEGVGYAPEAFRAILAEEGGRLTTVRPLVEHLRAMVETAEHVKPDPG